MLAVIALWPGSYPRNPMSTESVAPSAVSIRDGRNPVENTDSASTTMAGSTEPGPSERRMFTENSVSASTTTGAPRWLSTFS